MGIFIDDILGRWFEVNLEALVAPKTGKKLPFSLGADAEEGEVSDEDSADEIEDDCKLKASYSVAMQHRCSIAKQTLRSSPEEVILD
ncbi:UNVERIFIED_CONTAM: hypothetical protein K2H54_057776 [Gekko kuhli]